MEQGSPLYPLLNEVNAAAAGGAPFLAVTMTVTLPDICVSLQAADGRTSGKLYKTWCDENLPKERFSFVTPEDLYSMRCGVVHNGRFGGMKNNVGRIIFALPDSGLTIINSVMNDAYVYSVVDFCKEFTHAVYRWYESNRNDDNVKKNIGNLMQYREGGMAPYILGSTIIA